MKCTRSYCHGWLLQESTWRRTIRSLIQQWNTGNNLLILTRQDKELNTYTRTNEVINQQQVNWMKLNLVKTGTNTMKQSMQSWVNFWVRLRLVIKQLLL